MTSRDAETLTHPMGRPKQLLPNIEQSNPSVLHASLDPSFALSTYVSFTSSLLGEYVAQKLMEDARTELDLLTFQVTESDAANLATNLRYNKNITSLKVNSYLIGDEGAFHLAGLLSSNTCITELVLSANFSKRMQSGLSRKDITNKGAVKLSEMLKINTTLTKLDLSNNSISNKGVNAIAHALTVNNELKLLDLSGNCITFEGANRLGMTLQHNFSLQYLIMRNCKMSSEAVSNLISCLKYNRTLVGISVPKQGGEALTLKKQALKLVCENKVIQHLDIASSNEFSKALPTSFINSSGDKVSWLSVQQELRINKALIIEMMDWRGKNAGGEKPHKEKSPFRNSLRDRISHIAVDSEAGELSVSSDRPCNGKLSEKFEKTIVEGPSRVLIDLRNAELNSIPPTIFGLSSSIKELILSFNNLYEMPPEIGQFRSLTLLYINGNKITSLPVEMAELKYLEIIDVSCNRLREIPPCLKQLPQLLSLILHHNDLETLDEDLSGFSSLTELDVSFNSLSNLPLSLSMLDNLEILNLRGNQFKIFPFFLPVSSDDHLGSSPRFNSPRYAFHALSVQPPNEGEKNIRKVPALPPKLRYLDLQNNALQALPCALVYHPIARNLEVKGNPLITIPSSIVMKETSAIIQYLKDLRDYADQFSVVKVMVFGHDKVVSN